MNTDIYSKIESVHLKKTLPNFSAGDTVEVHLAIRDNSGEKKRVQIFRGLIILIKGSGIRKTMTVRKISDGIGVEKIFPIHSPNIEKIEILKKGKVKQANLYYMRDRIGKRAMKITDSGKEIEMIDTKGIIEEPVIEEEVVAEEKVEEVVAEEKVEEVVSEKTEEKA